VRLAGRGAEPWGRSSRLLIATYVGLSLAPVLLLFLFAAELLQGSVERWFSPTVRNVLEQGNAVAQAMNRQIEERNLRAAVRAARDVEAIDLRDPAARGRLATLLQELSTDLGLDFLGVYEESEFVHAVVSTQSGIPDLPEPGRSFLREVADRGQGRGVDPPGNYVGCCLGHGRPVGGGAAAHLVVAGTLLERACRPERAADPGLPDLPPSWRSKRRSSRPAIC
jgi:hypothetical protein